ncbi:MAG TPA: hypothetical protein EYH45_07570 [Candidatus Caldiarchaeum subterraneum]|uniref:Uncharacterized protein n=1 Tax=Caldiarchaeum subterraneum TaxID=311458 RepID=A0A832ZWZ7_CALS0|nr:hypothetical protein [Candidatus Caldarchaeum subterraneum]
MVLAAKIFEIKIPTNLEEIAEKLKDFKRVDEEEVEGRKFELHMTVDNLDMDDNYVTGNFNRDKIIFVNQRGNTVPILKTVTARIYIHRYGEKLLLTVLQKKHFANSVASILSNHLFLTYRGVVEARIPPENMREYHDRNPEATKVIYFDSLDFVGVDKVALYGDSLRATGKYEEYLSHGKIWYIVFTVRDSNVVLGLTRNCVVTSFSKMPENEFMGYIIREVFPMIE